MMSIAGYAAMALVGVSLGIIGAGGSILTVPILVYLFELPSSVATGYSLGIVGSTAIVALIQYARKKLVQWPMTVRFVPASICGVLIARKMLIPAIPDVIYHADQFQLTRDLLIMAVFAGVMIKAAISMIKPANLNSDNKTKGPMREITVAVVIGVVTGFVGAGGGFLIIPALVNIMGVPMAAAVGTSLFIIAVNSISGFVAVVGGATDVPWSLLISLAGIGCLTAAISSQFAHRIDQSKLKKFFGWFVFGMGIFILYEQLHRMGG
jgi:uncharacterized membrane protein YfcA